MKYGILRIRQYGQNENDVMKNLYLGILDCELLAKPRTFLKTMGPKKGI